MGNVLGFSRAVCDPFCQCVNDVNEPLLERTMDLDLLCTPSESGAPTYNINGIELPARILTGPQSRLYDFVVVLDIVREKTTSSLEFDIVFTVSELISQFSGKNMVLEIPIVSRTRSPNILTVYEDPAARPWLDAINHCRPAKTIEDTVDDHVERFMHFQSQCPFSNLLYDRSRGITWNFSQHQRSLGNFITVMKICKDIFTRLNAPTTMEYLKEAPTAIDTTNTETTGTKQMGPANAATPTVAKHDPVTPVQPSVDAPLIVLPSSSDNASSSSSSNTGSAMIDGIVDMLNDSDAYKGKQKSVPATQPATSNDLSIDQLLTPTTPTTPAVAATVKPLVLPSPPTNLHVSAATVAPATVAVVRSLHPTKKAPNALEVTSPAIPMDTDEMSYIRSHVNASNYSRFFDNVTEDNKQRVSVCEPIYTIQALNSLAFLNNLFVVRPGAPARYGITIPSKTVLPKTYSFTVALKLHVMYCRKSRLLEYIPASFRNFLVSNSFNQ
jgi:hypothetical protein